MIFTIISALVLILLLLIRSKRVKPFVTNEVAKNSILALSLVLIFSGSITLIVFLFKGKELYLIDYALATFILGVAVTGFVAETPEKKKFGKKGKK
ncbi:MAG TPA: hypothetical protein VNW06_02375 [Cytophagaceae bacterium]|jgi:hypothetical protein|nr:hypothetical protein [Cytophagaceae bacterium]